MDNYLSAKYASISIPVNVYNEDDIAAGNYDFDVAGILGGIKSKLDIIS